jgi:transcriptional regulator with XRE-family HTH domain
MPPRRKPTPDPAAVAPRLRELVAADGRSIRELARDLGIDHRNLHDILTGKTDPRASTLAAILAAMGKTWGDLDG